MSTVQGEAATPSTALEIRSPARPDWRRQPHTLFLVGLAAANVAFDGLAVGPLVDRAPSYFNFTSIFIGVLLAQLFLMGLWMAFGGLRAVARCAAVAAMTFAGVTAFWLGLGRNVVEFCNFADYSGMIVLATHALLLPLRALLGWRIDFDPAYHERLPDKTMQLRLIHLIAFTTACALPFALIQAAEDSDAVLDVFAFGGIGLVASVPVAWIVVAARRSWRFWLSAGGLLAVSLIVDLWALDGVYSPSPNGAFLLYLGVAATVAANLAALRYFFGLRLFSVYGPAELTAAARLYAEIDPDLAFMIDAWPRLPATVRSEVVQQVRSAASESGV